MKTSDFYYDLPEELIAQTPIEQRDTSRLMTVERGTGAVEHRHFYDLPDFLRPGDCLILNNSRVLPARLLGQRLHPLVHIRQGGSDPTYRPATVSIVVHTDQVFFLHGKVHFHTSNSFFLVLAAAFFGLAACLLSVSCLRIEGRGLRIDASRRSSLPIMAYTPCRSFMPVKHRDL